MYEQWIQSLIGQLHTLEATAGLHPNERANFHVAANELEMALDSIMHRIAYNQGAS